MKSKALLEVEIIFCHLKVHLWLVYVGKNLVYLQHLLIDLDILAIICWVFWILCAFDLAFRLVLASPHGSLPALEDKLGCYPRGRCGVVCVGKMLDAVFLDHC